MFTKNHNIVIISSSARAHAQSVSLSGPTIYTIDQFSDLDLSQKRHKKLDLESPQFFNDLLEYFRLLALPLMNTKIILGSGMEKWADSFSLLSEYGEVLGNAPNNYEICNNHKVFLNLLTKLDIKYPTTLFSKPENDTKWLQKSNYSNGGAHVQWLRNVKKQHQHDVYYQKYIHGVPISVLFLSDGLEHSVIGISKMLASSDNLHHPFKYTGAISDFNVNMKNISLINEIISKLVTTLKLVGLNGIDCIISDNLYVLECNPRLTATCELYSSRLKNGYLYAHMSAVKGKMCQPLLSKNQLFYGHRILYATKSFTLPASITWPQWINDIPQKEAQIQKYLPVCSVFASANTQQLLEEKLERRAMLIIDLIKYCK